MLLAIGEDPAREGLLCFLFRDGVEVTPQAAELQLAA
jgi:hypothetical protein